MADVLAPVLHLIEAYPDRLERMYAAAFAHWLHECKGDRAEARYESADRAKGIPGPRSARIRREIGDAWDLAQRGSGSCSA